MQLGANPAASGEIGSSLSLKGERKEGFTDEQH